MVFSKFFSFIFFGQIWSLYLKFVWCRGRLLYAYFDFNVYFFQNFCHSYFWANLTPNNTISLSCHEQVSLSGLRFERYFSHHPANDGRGISQNVAHLNMLVHDVINLFNYEHWTDKQKCFYVYFSVLVCSNDWTSLELRHRHWRSFMGQRKILEKPVIYHDSWHEQFDWPLLFQR